MNINVQKAQDNELAILKALNKYGWLVISQLVALIWPDSTNDQMARRTLSRLFSNQEVTLHKHEGLNCYALAKAGAKRLRELGIESHSTDFLFKDGLGLFNHRLIANNACIYHSKCPYNRVVSEFEIQSRGALNFPAAFNKVPDYFIYTPYGGIWGEVELSKKASKDKERFILFLRMLLKLAPDLCTNPCLDPVNDIYLFRLEVISGPNGIKQENLEKWLAPYLSDSPKDVLNTWFLFRDLNMQVIETEEL